MKITIIYENTMNEDGEDSVVTFSKDGVEFLEDTLNAMGRSLHAVGFTYVHSLQAETDDGTKFMGHF